MNAKFYDKDLLSLNEASTYTGFSKSWLYQLCHKRAIPYYKPGGKKTYFKKSDLDSWMLNNRQATAQELSMEAINTLKFKQ